MKTPSTHPDEYTVVTLSSGASATVLKDINPLELQALTVMFGRASVAMPVDVLIEAQDEAKQTPIPLVKKPSIGAFTSRFGVRKT